MGAHGFHEVWHVHERGSQNRVASGHDIETDSPHDSRENASLSLARLEASRRETCIWLMPT